MCSGRGIGDAYGKLPFWRERGRTFLRRTRISIHLNLAASAEQFKLYGSIE
jgi:hypothetical protein